ncbi:MAG TPA: hypothetical protein PLN21_22695 [Gemmatales bacterium]|nr:hypothetical protein [Gemmatales bacterium]
MDPFYLDRPDLLDEPLFWQGMFYGPFEPTVEDVFKTTEEHFGLRPTRLDANRFFEDLEETKIPCDYYPAHFVPVTETNNWRVGVTWHAIPRDFMITFDIVDSTANHVELGELGGHFRLPVFRWCEVQSLALTVHSDRRAKAYIALVLLPGIWFGKDEQLLEIREQVISAMAEINFATKRLPELADRILAYQQDDNLHWYFDEQFGWVNNEVCSKRNPDRCKDLTLFHSVRELFRGVMVD